MRFISLKKFMRALFSVKSGPKIKVRNVGSLYHLLHSQVYRKGLKL